MFSVKLQVAASGCTTFTAAVSAVTAAVLALFLFAAAACAGGEDGAQGVYSSHGGSPWATYYRYLEENPEIYAEADTSFPNGQTKYGKNGETQKTIPGPRIPGKIWPIVTQPSIPQGPEKMMNWARTMDRITNYSQEPVGSVNLSPAFAALSLGVAGQMLADELQSPQATMPRAREEQNQQIQLSADNTAAMERQQAGCAIDFVASYLYNFTIEEGNKWNQVRNRLFLPMALLLLLPGAILAQVKSIASQGFAVLGEVSPFDGLTRSIIAIFLIPGTYLVVNYGIDVANSITKVVSEEYTHIFGTNMYEDAMCAHIRAFPFREPIENKNFVPNAEAKMGRLSPSNTPFAELEGKMLNVKLTDPCAKLNIVPADRANEQVKYSVNAQRNAYNTANAALAMAWNILCAFQMAYLYYLWFVGPVVAALWVYPMKQLRDAFPSWCEGVITICFWSLFWSTVVLLMACFRGVDETGTVIMTALNFLATACVKFAFDFAGLVKDAGREAGRMAERMAAAAGGGAKGSPHGVQNAHGGAHGANGQGAHGTSGTNGSHGAPSAVPGADGTLASSGPNGALGMEGFEGAEGATGLPGGMAANNASGINGAVSMHDFPHPPITGAHHGGALGVIGTTLGSAGLFAGLAAMAQPHFMNNHPGLAGGIPSATGDSDNTPGTTGSTGTSDTTSTTGSDNGIPLAMTGGGLGGMNLAPDSTVVNEGDMYEHNWGESALSAPIESASLTPDGPPLSSLPVSPSLSLTPDMNGSVGLPPSSTTDKIATANAASMQNQNIVASTIDAGTTNILVGDTAHHVSANHRTAHHAVGEHIAHNEQHATHHQAGSQHQHELTNVNAMFKDSVAMSIGSVSQPPANFTSTDYSLTANNLQQQQQQYVDYSMANSNSSMNVVSNPDSSMNIAAPNSGNSVNIAADNGATPAYYDASTASFAALAQSVTGDTVTQIDDGSVVYHDAGISTASVTGDYTDYTTSTSSTVYGVDYSSTYSGDSYSTALPTAGLAPATPDSQPIPITANISSAPTGPLPDAITTSTGSTIPPQFTAGPVPSADIRMNESQTQYALPAGTPEVLMRPSITPSAEPPQPQQSAPSDAQQLLRNKLAMPDGTPGKNAPVNQPKNVNVAPPGGKQINPATAAKQSALGAALGKAGTRSPQQLQKPAAPPSQPQTPASKPVSKPPSLHDSVTAGSTRNRYVQSSGLTDEELAELEAKARQSGTWLQT